MAINPAMLRGAKRTSVDDRPREKGTQIDGDGDRDGPQKLGSRLSL